MHIDYWDAEGADVLTHTDTDEAIEACLGNMDVGDWPETVVVDGFVIVEPLPTSRIHEKIIDVVLDDLDEHYGSVEGSAPEVTSKMREAANLFIQTVVSEYDGQPVERVKTVTVNSIDWIKENCPEWLIGTQGNGIL